MAKDLVCGSSIDEKKAGASYQYEGRLISSVEHCVRTSLPKPLISLLINEANPTRKG